MHITVDCVRVTLQPAQSAVNLIFIKPDPTIGIRQRGLDPFLPYQLIGQVMSEHASKFDLFKHEGQFAACRSALPTKTLVRSSRLIK